MRMRQATGVAAALILAACAAALLAAGTAEADQSTLIDQESVQGEVGYLSSQGAGDFGALAEEMEVNFGADKAASPEKARVLLNEVADKDVPAVMDNLRRMRTATGAARRTEAGAIVQSQDAILGKIKGLMDTSVKGVASDTLAQQAQALIEAESAAQNEAKSVGAQTLGARPADLSPEAKAALDKAAAGQERLARDLAALERSATAAAADPNADAIARERAAKAVAAGQLDKARASMEQAADALKENKVGQAVALEEDATAKLQAFKDALEGSTPAQSPDAALAALTAGERSLADETKRLPAGDAQALAERQDGMRAAADALAPEMRENFLASAHVAAAADEMAEAAEALSKAAEPGQQAETAKDATAQAAARQEQALKHLAAAQKALADPSQNDAFKALSEKMDETQKAAADVAELDSMLNEERGLKGQTDKADTAPDALAALAPKQADLQKRAEDFARKSEPPQGAKASPAGEKNANDASGAADMKAAAGAMAEAQNALESQRRVKASRSQNQAIEAMQSARDKRAEAMDKAADEMTQQANAAGEQAGKEDTPPDAAALMEQARQMAANVERARQSNSLAGEERKLAAGSRSLPSGDQGRAEAAAASQDALSGKAQSMAADPSAPQAFSETVGKAKGEMSGASGELRGGNPGNAAGRQATAARLLSQAAGQALAAARQPQSRQLSRRSGRMPATGITRATTGTPGRIGQSPGGATWIATLPPNTPPDVLQAASGAFPRGYEETLRKYFESIASKSLFQ